MLHLVGLIYYTYSKSGILWFILMKYNIRVHVTIPHVLLKVAVLRGQVIGGK